MIYIKCLLIILILLLPTNSFAEYKFAENWTREDTIFQGFAIALNAIDWHQTRYIAEHPIYYENNAILGKHPSVSSVDTYFLTSMVVQTLVSLATPKKYRVYIQSFQVGLSGGCVALNINIGIK